MTLPLSEVNEGLDLGMRVSTFVLRTKYGTPPSENAGLDLVDMRGSTFVLEAKVAHPLSENAGSFRPLTVRGLRTFKMLEAKCWHTPLSENVRSRASLEVALSLDFTSWRQKWHTLLSETTILELLLSFR